MMFLPTFKTSRSRPVLSNVLTYAKSTTQSRTYSSGKQLRAAILDSTAATRPDSGSSVSDAQPLPAVDASNPKPQALNVRKRFPFLKEQSSRARRIHLRRRGVLFDPDTGLCVLNPRALRNGCRCNVCVHPSDRQRQFNFTHIPDDIGIASHSVDTQGTYHIKWTSDVPGMTDHVSQYTKSDIMEIGVEYTPPQPQQPRGPRSLWTSNDFSVKRNTFEFESVMNDSSALASALGNLDKFGLIFLNGVPQAENSVGTISSRIGLVRNTFYRPMWDVRSVPDAKNVAYTSRDLGFHMDLLYMKEPPGFQLLHCMENTCEGGLSQFVDTFKILEFMAEKTQNVRLLDQLSQTHIEYEYSNDGKHYRDTKPVVKLQNFPNKRLEISTMDLLRKNLVNNSDLRVYWSPPFVAPLINNPYGRTPHHRSLGRSFADALERPGMAVTTKLAPGTCAIFDNLRIVHARTAFDTSAGHRWLRGAYADHQDVYSTMASVKHLQSNTGSNGLYPSSRSIAVNNTL